MPSIVPFKYSVGTFISAMESASGKQALRKFEIEPVISLHDK